MTAHETRRRVSLHAARWSAFTIALATGVTLAYIDRSLVSLLLAVVFTGGFLLFAATFTHGAPREVVNAHTTNLREDLAQVHAETLARLEAVPRIDPRWAAVSPYFDQRAAQRAAPLFDQDDPAVSRLDKLDGVGSRHSNS